MFLISHVKELSRIQVIQQLPGAAFQEQDYYDPSGRQMERGPASI